ncbi:hypothetical protein [Cellulomonas fengjieae]|uniref:Uncharacterized protein n=1 Tax=Cellulomonas fengjieae TaxID=2819978 RepID=A0ABS3SK38_9CELL|nr:hypothetical protein [Cellulomonas fengjieae]MBO3085340.1 hypothetical protein [Cellulomonas fengjieae]QVI66106.1 hypothetical protein KG102_00245 [Cellulomonas fengjieae]
MPDLLFDLADGAAADSFFFRGLGAEHAVPLLAALDPDVLDARAGPGPSLGAALRAAAAHPGVVLLTGHVIGPSREDERLTVDGLVVSGDPVLDGLGEADVARAWDRVVALGIDDALAPPDELRPPSSNEPDGASGWTVWWD